MFREQCLWTWSLEQWIPFVLDYTGRSSALTILCLVSQEVLNFKYNIFPTFCPAFVLYQLHVGVMSAQYLSYIIPMLA